MKNRIPNYLTFFSRSLLTFALISGLLTGIQPLNAQFSISGIAWKDLNGNGYYNPYYEPGMQNVEVVLFKLPENIALGLPLITGADGHYSFIELDPGDYYIRFNSLMPNYVISPGPDNHVTGFHGPGTTNTITINDANITGINAGYKITNPADCEAPSANWCMDAEILCSLAELNDFCALMLPQFTQQTIPGCPGNGWQNPSWFAFVAGAETVSLILHAFDCVGGNAQTGIQFGFYEDCNYSNPQAYQCDFIAAPGDYNIMLTDLIVGKAYYFWVDGWAGTRCGYWLEFISGGGAPEIIGPSKISCNTDFPDCGNICPDATVTFLLDDIFNAARYEWTINGGEINGGEITETLIPELTHRFTEPGIYTICGRGMNFCDEGEWFCFDIEVVTQISPQDLGVVNVCKTDLIFGVIPEGWRGPAITSAGNHSFLTFNEHGCYFEQLVKVNATRIKEIFIDTIACNVESIWIAGVLFDSDVLDFELLIENPDTAFCDELYKINLSFIGIDGHLDYECLGSADAPVKLFFVPTEIIGTYDIEYSWYLNGIPLLDDQYSTGEIITDQNGIYSLEVTLISEKGICYINHFDSVAIDIEDFLIDRSVIKTGNTLTSNEADGEYQWLDCNDGMVALDGETGKSYTPIKSGYYAVEIEKNGCVDTSDCYVFILTGINDILFGREFIIYPNPGDNKVTIDLKDTYSQIAINVYNAEGREVFSQRYINISSLKLDTEWASGLYHFVITSGDRSAVLPFVSK